MADPATTIGDDARPRLAPGVRLHFDTRRQAWLLLAPERVIEADPPANDILSRCDGTRTFGTIVDELAELYTADRSVIAGDAADLLLELSSKRLVVL